MPLTAHDRVRIAAEAIVNPRTVERIYRGDRCTISTYERVRRAAEGLRYPAPPPPDRRPEVA